MSEQEQKSNDIKDISKQEQRWSEYKYEGLSLLVMEGDKSIGSGIVMQIVE